MCLVQYIMNPRYLPLPKTYAFNACRYDTTRNANMSQHAIQICHNIQCKYVTTCHTNLSQHAMQICHNMQCKFVTTCNANMSRHAMQICPSMPYRHYCTVLLLHFKTLPTISITAGTLYRTLSHYLVFPPRAWFG